MWRLRSHSAQLIGSMSAAVGSARPTFIAEKRMPSATCAAK